jgi:hypothetical protein
VTYAQLHQRLQDLIARGAKVADATAGTPAAQIHDWINKAQLCLLLLEDKMPTLLADFRRMQPNFEFKVDEDEEAGSSNSAYRPSWIDQRTGLKDGADVLLDFRFDLLDQANGILKLAATKLEMEGHSLPGNFSDERLGEELLAARKRAGHSLRQAATKIGYDHKYLSEWERGKRKPHPEAAKNIRDYILLHSDYI